ncbi:MAG TPA: UDP-glucose 4-epimerase GalE [Bryobacteraceae bacterium]|nr:UDP-glucose 4-epimerase GalE [Bryobacteraceae bacterium]
MNVLVTGGAGYIGSHTAKHLAVSGHQPIVLDNLSKGHRWAVRWGPLIEGDLADRDLLAHVFRAHSINAVIHFAAVAYVGESMKLPADYFRNNVVNTLNLLDSMRESGVNALVFSSSCATYGAPRKIPIPDDHPQQPVNPYGESKYMVERMLHWHGKAYGLRWSSLRYFNAAGADPGAEIGELHQPETHVIPRAIAAALGDLPEMEIFGVDYDTPDGTAVRDYIHVTDLATAHLLALERIQRQESSGAMNLGTGRGYSVREVIAMVERVGQRRVPVRECPRRPGDPPVLVADASRAARVLGWAPSYSQLETIVETAWCWYLSRRQISGAKDHSAAAAKQERCAP